LKSLIVEFSFDYKRTHSIDLLKSIIEEKGIRVDLSQEECEFLDSIYLPSKYPLSSSLPVFNPDEEVCRQYISVAEKIKAWVELIQNDQENQNA